MAIRYICKNCRKFTSKDAVVCKHCGEPNPAIPVEPKSIQFESAETTTESKTPQRSQWKKILKFSIIGLVVGLGLGKCIASLDDGIKQGEECVFIYDEVGCVSKEANDKLLDISLRSDNFGVINMLSTGEASSISAGTHCVYQKDLQNGFSWVRVDSKFQSLIVPTKSIKRVNDK